MPLLPVGLEEEPAVGAVSLSRLDESHVICRIAWRCIGDEAKGRGC